MGTQFLFVCFADLSKALEGGSGLGPQQGCAEPWVRDLGTGRRQCLPKWKEGAPEPALPSDLHMEVQRPVREGAWPVRKKQIQRGLGRGL